MLLRLIDTTHQWSDDESFRVEKLLYLKKMFFGELLIILFVPIFLKTKLKSGHRENSLPQQSMQRNRGKQ